MQVIEATGKKLFREFLSFPTELYKNDPNWISISSSGVKDVFDPEKNNFYSEDSCCQWILQDPSQKTIGRIAAFINHKKTNGTPIGGIGFFECIDDQASAHMLFNTAKEWLRQKHMVAMDGPINLGENISYWGLLVEGFKDPSFGMNYNFPYYKNLFESYGFTRLYDQFTNLLDATIALPERFSKISDRVMNNSGYEFRHFDKKQPERFIREFVEVYNDAWSGFENFRPMEMETIAATFAGMKAVIDEKIIWYAYCHGEPAAFIVCVPDVNRIFKHLKGDLNFWNKMKFLWYKRTTTIDRLRILVMGCKKKFQNRGLESALIRCLQKEVLPRHTIKEVELAWVGDFNAKMMSLHAATGAKKDKVHRTYRYYFNGGN